jgi:aryl-alcohol dehydrogenase-like predicted oxidoreductase
MQYAHLGRTGAKVSRLALGTMNFGWHTDEPNSQTIMDAALDAGINFFDTADIYGAGASEEILGRWFAAGSPLVRADETRSCWPPSSTFR